MTAITRVEHDSMGALDVPNGALWGAQSLLDPRTLTEGGIQGAGP